MNRSRPPRLTQHDGTAAFCTADELAIRNLHEAWIEAEKRGDVEAVLQLVTEDVEWAPPGGPSVFGRVAGRRLLQATTTRLLSIATTEYAVERVEGRAIKRCRYETVFESTATGRSGTVRGEHTWTLVKGVSGWRVASVSWQTDAGGEG